MTSSSGEASDDAASISVNTLTRCVDASYSITLAVVKVNSGDSDSMTIEVENGEHSYFGSHVKGSSYILSVI